MFINISQKSIALFAVASFILLPFSIQYAQAQTMPSPVAADGGPDAHLYKTDTVILENSILNDGSGIEPEKTITAGFSQLHSPYIKFFYIPLSYSLTDNISLNFTLPFMHKMLIDNTNDVSRLAFGDIKLGLTSSFSFMSDTVKLNTHFNTTLPTGDSNASSGSILIPLGYGNFTFSLFQSLSIEASGIFTRFFLNAGGIIYLPSEYTYYDTATYMVDKTYTISSLIGFEVSYFKNVYLSLRGNFVYIPSRTYKERDESTDAVSSEYNVNDMLMTSDLIPALTYLFNEEIKGTLMLIFPMWTKEDSHVSFTSDRVWKMYFSIEKTFSLTAQETIPAPAPGPSKNKNIKRKTKKKRTTT